MFPEYISIETLTRSAFESQVDSIIQTFIEQALAIFRRRNEYIIDTFHTNQLLTMFLTNWNVSATATAEDYIISTNSQVYIDVNGSSCLCATSSTCSRPLVFYFDTESIILPGLIGGCLPISGLRLSTLECFYNLSCITQLFLVAKISTISYPILDITVPTRFTPISTTLIGTLIDELFIESWYNSSNYSEYYSTCAPLKCQYSYVKQNDAIYVFTAFLGLYGGLTIAIKSIVWFGLCIYRKLHQYFIIHQCSVEPTGEI